MLPTIHNDLEPQKSKGRGAMILLLIIILMAAVGGGVYYWQKMEAKKLASTAEEKVRNEMQVKIDETKNNLTELQKKLDEQNAVNNTDGWETYTNPTLNYSIKYPNSYKIDAEHSTDNSVFWQNENSKNVMSIKYRTETVNGTLDTWFDNPKLDAIKLANIDGFKYQFKYCDGPGCGPETIAFVIPYNEKLLGLEFQGDYEYSQIEQKIFNTFKILQTGENVFDPNLLKVGDKIGNMTVKEIGPMNISDPIDVNNNYKVSFTGKVNVSGELFFSELGNKYCFDVNQVDWVKIPKLKNDERYPWFCLNKTNAATIDDIISANEGKANITIDNYILSEYPTSGSDTADLIKINN